MLFLVISIYFQLLVGLSWSQAPGDETCTITPYPDTEKNLMDSRNYIYLLPGNGTGRNIQAGAVWNDYSFDGNDEIQIFTGTFWRHGVAGNCRRTADVCGYDRSGTAQNNWLFTQRISKSFDSNTYNYPVTIHVNITYRMTGCRDDRQPPCIQGFTLFYYLTNSVRLPSLEGNGYMNRNNYQSFAYPYAPENGENYVNIYNFTLPSTSTGFYVAARDNGTCISIRRLRVYRENCKEQRIGLVLYPDAPAPVSGSANINVQCVENAEFASGRSMASCTSSGEWGPVVPICQCRLGYERTEVNSLSQCRVGLSQAPGDETCTITPYPDTEKNLMDSRNYIYLLPGNGTGRNIQAGAVWNDYSFDGNDEIHIFTGTFWRHGVAGNCRRTADVCGFDRPGTTQNNWLFTQHINKSFDSNTYNYPVTIHVNVTYRMTGCRDDRQPPCTQGFTLFYYLTNSVQLPSLEGNGYMNRNNYQSFAYPYAPENGENYVNIYNFTLPSTSTGFYVAARDNGTCTSIRRLRVYRENCKEQRIGLVLYPDAPAPVSGSVNINVQCVENAEHASGQSMASCTSNGEWGTVVPICQCRLGYEGHEVNSLSQCRACPAGEYRSVTDTVCQTCPPNTITTEVAAPKCSCMTDYFRKRIPDPENPFCSGIEPPSAGCTQPPSAPRDVSSTVQKNSMTVRWSHPADNGGRDDLHYLLILRDPAVPDTSINKTYLAGDKTTITFYNLQPFTQYCVQVIAHNCVSDQDSGRTQTRTVELCNKTLEVPGTVTRVKGTYPYVVWNPPADLNGVISGYRLVFSRSGTSITRTRTTNTDQTFYIIQSSDIPWTSGEFRVTVSARNQAGFGPQSSPLTLSLDACKAPSLPTCVSSDETRPNIITGLMKINCTSIRWDVADVEGCTEMDMTYRIRLFSGPTYRQSTDRVILSSGTNSLTFTCDQVRFSGSLRVVVKARRSNGVLSARWTPCVTIRDAMGC